MRATETGALERLRTGQQLSSEDVEIINALPTVTAQHLDGSEESVWKQLSDIVCRDPDPAQ